MISIISIFTALIGNYILNSFFSSKEFRFQLLKGKKMNTYETTAFILNKLAGFVMLGLIPGIIVFAFFSQSPIDVGLSFGHTRDFWYLTGLIALVIVFIYFQAKNPIFYNRYPEMRHTNWTKSKIVVSILGWTIYLLGYEFLFRGLLFFSLYQSFGLIASLLINVSIYSATHIQKGKDEFLCTIPFGILLCIISFLTGSIILPFLIHLSLALSTDFFSIHYNPKMKMVRS